jgi:hypothetical protein
MWEYLHEIELSDHPGAFDVTDVALRWGYPLWMHPDGLSLLETFFRQDPTNAITVLSESLHLWQDNTDPKMIAPIRRVLIDLVLPMAPWSDDDAILAWIESIGTMLRIDPSIGNDVPAAVGAIITACTSDITFDSAFSILTTIPLFPHPRTIATMAEIIQQTDVLGIQQEMADYLMTYCLRSSDPYLRHQLVIPAGHIVMDPTRDEEERIRAAVILQAAMQWRDTAEMVRPYLQMVYTDPTIPDEVLRLLSETRYPPGLTEDMIAFARSLLRTQHESHAIPILVRAWGNGYDDRILNTISAIADSNDQIDVLLPGLYAPDTGARVVALLSSLDPTHAGIHILDGIARYRKPNRPIPPEVVPAVVKACLESPPTPLVQDRIADVLEVIAATDLAMALMVIQNLVRRDHPEWHDIRIAAIRSVGSTWGKGDDQMVAACIRSLIQSIPVETSSVLVPYLVDGVLDGFQGGGDHTVLLDVFHYLVDHVSWNHSIDIAKAFAARQQSIWHDAGPRTTVEMLRIIASRRQKSEPTTQTIERTISLLRSVRNGWRCHDTGVVMDLFDDIMRDTLSRFPVPPTAAHIREVVEMVQCLCDGWGWGCDHAVGRRLYQLMHWLDTHIPNWMTDPSIGPIVLLHITSGGGKQDNASLGHTNIPNPPVWERVRAVLKRWLDQHNDS